MQISIFTTRFCPYCIAAKRLLSQLGLDYEETPVDGNPQLRATMQQRSGRHTVPQIWIGDQHVGGYDDLNFIHRNGQLQQLVGDFTATP